MERVGRSQVRYAYEGCKRHAIAVFDLQMYVCMTRGQVGTVLTVGGVVKTARYPHTAKILQFGGRFDSEGVELARIHIPQLTLSTLWWGGAASAVPAGKGGDSAESRACDL